MKAASRSVAFRLLLFSALLAANSPGAEPNAFEVSGCIETTAGTTNRRAFVFATHGPSLLIRLNSGADDEGVDYIEFGSDGTNGFIYSKTLFRVNPSSPQRVRNDATLHIEPSPVPRAAGVIQYVWLVYAGHSELKIRTNSYLKPLGVIQPQGPPFDPEVLRMREHLLLRAEWEFDGHAPYLLKSFVDYRDSKLASDRFSQSLIPAVFMNGRTNSQMDVLSWTNVAGLRIPIHARYTTYVTDTSKPEQPLQMYVIHHVVATNVVAGTQRRDFIPKLSKATEVFDYRFAAGPGLPARYLATNGIVLGTRDEAWAEAMRK